jgi:hypothetical protein
VGGSKSVILVSGSGLEMNALPNPANRIEVTMETLLDSVVLAEGITERVARHVR